MILTSTVGGYLLASIIQFFNLFGKITSFRALLRPVSFAALVGHGWLLYRLIELDAGQNLDAILMLSMILWLMGLIVFMTFNEALNKLNCTIYVLAGLSLPVAYATHGQHVVTTISPMLLFHILVSFMAIAVLLLAWLQALVLSAQNYLLRYHSNHPLLNVLAPLLQMERLLFVIIGAGFGLLSLSLASGLFFPELLLSQANLPKTLLATLAWCMFLGILLARFAWGLRGASAHRLTLLSGVLLFCSYFGTQFII